jgi:predicted CoA-binding protein
MTDDAALRRILTRTRVIAAVGVSPDPVRPSHYVGRYLWRRGYRVIPVNPKIAGMRLFDETAVAGLDEIDAPVDMIDIFRRPEHVPELWQTARAVLPGLRTVWMQIGVRHPQVAAEAAAAGLDVVQDCCPKIEHQRLFGELRKAGIATGIVSSRL